MPDYRRFIAYFYEYIDGKRQRNAGFVKAEQRDGMWKIDLQLKARRWPEERVEIYGYDGGDEGYSLTLLGNGYPKKDGMMQRLQLNGDWRSESGKTFETLSGVWIPCGEKRCFLSHWTQGEADLSKFKIGGQPHQDVMETRKTREVSEEPERVQKTSEEVELPGGIQQTLTNQPEDLAWANAPKLRQEPQETLADMKQVLEESVTAVDDGAVEEVEAAVVEAVEVEEDRAAVVAEAVEVEEDRAAAVAEAVEVEEDRAAVVAEAVEVEEDWAAAVAEAVEVEEDRAAVVTEGVQQTVTLEAQKEENGRTVMEEEQRSRKEQIWREMKRSHLNIAPFPEYECIVICPRDVLWLRRQGWPVGRNNFLMQGFSQYHHLILGKTMEENGNTGEKNDGEAYFILGIPGIENPKNRGAAQVFGYGEFLSGAEERKGGEAGQREEPREERFGYWCRRIK